MQIDAVVADLSSTVTWSDDEGWTWSEPASIDPKGDLVCGDSVAGLEGHLPGEMDIFPDFVHPGRPTDSSAFPPSTSGSTVARYPK